MAKKDVAGERALPPYVSFKTFQGFIQKLKATTVPGRVDSSVLRTYAGSVARKLAAALRFLGLIEEGGRTTEKLTRLVAAYETPEWAVVLNEILTDAYKSITINLNLMTATPAELDECFRDWGAGSSVPACVSFYVAALRAAGVPVSPHVVHKARGRPDRARGRSKRTSTESEKPQADGSMMDTVPAAAAVGTVRFSFPIPSKAAVTMFLPADLTAEDWEMVDAMVKAYVERRKKS